MLNVATISQIVHVDDELIVAHKPAGLLSVPGRGVDKQDCLSARLAAQFGDIHVVHRLDQATSGLIVFARNMAALQHMHAQFRDGTVDKAYEAVVHGKPDQPSFMVNLPLMADWPHRPKQKVAFGDDALRGKPSMTHVNVLSFYSIANTSRVWLVPVTGRTHQLRVHMAAIKHSIVGDRLYGDAAIDTKSSRLMLHATQLQFTHPVTGERVMFELKPNF